LFEALPSSKVWPADLFSSRLFMFLKKLLFGWAQVTHTYNPSYSEGRDQKAFGSKPTQANSL
jgi:hypothetical protein